MDKLRYGIIGFGGIAENRITKEGFGLDSARFEPNTTAELIAAMDLSSARQEPAEALGLKWYTGVDEMLEDSQIDAVFIATNNSTHAEIAQKAIAAGKHVLVEKPIACTLTEANMLRTLAKEQKISLTVDHMMTKNAYNEEAARIISEGKLGNVNDICLHMEFLYGSTEQEAKTWRCSKPGELGGPIGDVGSHCLYMAEFLLNDEIIEVSCVYTPPTLDIRVENGAFIQFLTKKGIRGTVKVAFNQPRGGLVGTLSNLGYEVYGTEGVLRSYGALFQLSGHEGEPIKIRLELESAAGVEKIVPETCHNIYSQQIAQHALSVRNGKLLDGSGAVHNLQLLLACHESAVDQAKIVRL